MLDPRFFVYRLYNDPAVTIYVGKGSGRRFERQMTKFRCQGEIIEHYDNEKQAYRAERKYIKSLKPELNKNGGGGGAALRKRRPFDFMEWLNRPENVQRARQWSAREMLKVAIPWDAETLAIIKEVAAGTEVNRPNA